MASKLKDTESIEKIIREMTVEEKAACVTGNSSFYSRAMEKYGIPKLLLLDGGTGFNSNEYYLDKAFQAYAKRKAAEGTPLNEEDFTGRMGGLEVVLSDKEAWENRTDSAKDEIGQDQNIGCYPSGMLMGATWNPDVIEACGHALGNEANVRGVDVLLGTPNVNIHRDPLNGRLFEGYSEDPCLVSKLAPSFVKGIQDEGVAADVKHFAANNQETDRMGVNEHIPERALREIYLPGFQACVQAGCKTVMSAYNKINGAACAQNRHLLHDILRDEWGFKGCVVSDWSAAYDQAQAAAAGNDLVMPGPRQLSPVVNAVKNGKLKEELLDECVRNYLKLVLETPAMKGRKKEYSVEAGKEAAYQAAKEGITLLKNDGVLPLKAGSRISFYGNKCLKMMDSCAGSAAVNTNLTTSLYECAADLTGKDHVNFEVTDERTDVIVAAVSANGQEGVDRQNMLMESEDRISLNKAIEASEHFGKPLIVCMNLAAPIQIIDWESKANAILSLFIPGMMGGKAAADILFGKVNPSGKLPLTFPRYYSDTPSSLNFPGYNSEVWYGEGIYVGYRYYEKKHMDVMYPFGYGLSYQCHLVNQFQIKIQWFSFRESHCFFSSKT
jgi:beta-glucosidase